MEDYLPFKVGLEEIVLELQSRKAKFNFQLAIAQGNRRYVEGMIRYYEGKVDGVKEVFNYVTARYEQAVAGYIITNRD